MSAKSFTSLDKAFEILFSFQADRQEQTAQEIARSAGMPISTTYRYLDRLVRHSLLSHHLDKGVYRLGYGLIKLGNLAALGAELIEAATPHMKALADRMGETVFLTVISGREALCVERIESPQALRLSVVKGSTRPLHAGCSSRVLLAYQKEEFIEDYLNAGRLDKITDRTPTDPEAIRRDLENIRQVGYATSAGETDLGTRAVAAPIFDGRGRLVGGLAAAGPSNRVRGSKVQKVAELVVSRARAVSAALGYR
jgi:DNA-binding IclR family transcriptional regulator